MYLDPYATPSCLKLTVIGLSSSHIFGLPGSIFGLSMFLTRENKDYLLAKLGFKDTQYSTVGRSTNAKMSATLSQNVKTGNK
ncbi:hypothetical protein ROZALSC1DRAFT_30100 [Rozella allomycis CSF55]|uniref:Uncharacterized protein n=1 Tax=Rozella allomycis (strain CSF55) TaxID=988480 RepID=A0A075AWS0_ROZAC|nr:hypothetical protein O9G_004497 [Rozella allomycis CSF55]RKP18177.1 hypothetical protein ROZALSC1DRAFT_30100 [Rozella allomycis CSF55]|eukprot:EPZ34785.1 hypothetical protein O9G_004497 [Rozella allomycis CSF55]